MSVICCNMKKSCFFEKLSESVWGGAVRGVLENTAPAELEFSFNSLTQLLAELEFSLNSLCLLQTSLTVECLCVM